MGGRLAQTSSAIGWPATNQILPLGNLTWDVQRWLICIEGSMGYVLQQNKGMPGPCTKLHLRKKVWLRTLADGESVRGKRKNGREAQRGWRWNARGERCRQRERDCLYEPLRDMIPSTNSCLKPIMRERRRRRRWTGGGGGACAIKHTPSPRGNAVRLI